MDRREVLERAVALITEVKFPNSLNQQPVQIITDTLNALASKPKPSQTEITSCCKALLAARHELLEQLKLGEPLNNGVSQFIGEVVSIVARWLISSAMFEGAAHAESPSIPPSTGVGWGQG